MKAVSILEATSSLSRLVDDLEHGREKEFVIVRDGRPVAKLSPLRSPSASRRIGVAKGIFEVPDDIDAHADEVAELFHRRADD